MNDYKGIYHNVQDKTESFEFGAHFKYSELYNILKDLQIKQQNENKVEDDKYISPKKTENKEEIEITKKRKKLKLKTFAGNDNKRYLITDVTKKDNDNDDFSVIEEEQENKKVHKRKKNKYMTKSVEKVRLPNISSNSLISLQNMVSHKNILAESYDAHNLKKKKDKDKKINFPKINALHRNNPLFESEKNHMIFETQSRFQDNGAIKIYNGTEDKESSNQSSSKNHQFLQLNNISQDNDNEGKNEFLAKPQRRTNKLLSIFEKEKLRKNNNYNLFLGEKNIYLNKEHRDIMNNEMAKQIHNLKKQLKGNSNKSLQYVHK